MFTESYLPNLLSYEIVADSAFYDLLLDSGSGICCLDGMLRFIELKEIVRNFLKTEEVLSAAFLEVPDVSFEEYLDTRFDQGYESDDLVEIRFMIGFYSVAEKKFNDTGFSFSFLKNFNQELYKNHMTRDIDSDKIVRHRHPWSIINTNDYTDESKINNLMNNLEDFIIHNSSHPLITAAISYGQFAMIHPYQYANGRTTGAFFPFLLNYLGITKEQSCYISGAFRKDKAEYYRQLGNLMKEETWEKWIRYFLETVKKHSIIAQNKVEHILSFSLSLINEAEQLISSTQAKRVINALLMQPLFTPREIEKGNGMPIGAIDNILEVLIEAGYLVKDNRKRDMNYMFTEMFTIFDM